MGAYPITASELCTSLGRTVAASHRAWSTGQTGFTDAGVAEIVGPLPALPDPWSSSGDRPLSLAWAVLQNLTVPLAEASRRWGPARLGVLIATDGWAGGAGSFEDAIVELSRQHARARGPAYATIGGISASGQALATAVRLLDSDWCDAVLCVAASGPLQERAAFWSDRNELGSLQSRPMTVGRDGVRLGEGAAAVLLERQGTSETQVLAVESATGDDGAAHALRVVLERAGVPRDRVSWVNCGADGRVDADRRLARAIDAELGRSTPVTTPAGVRGELGAAQDLVAVVEAVASIESGRVGPVAAPLDPRFDLRAVKETVRLETDHALCLHAGVDGDFTAVLVGACEP